LINPVTFFFFGAIVFPSCVWGLIVWGFKLN
jgi:hypothetical protein